MMRAVGFTGTSKGMTAAQASAVKLALSADTSPAEFHHGDCVGADAEAHEIALGLSMGIVIHPPSDPRHRAWCRGGDVREPRPYLERNRHIVLASGVLLAAPGGEREILRSGTWSTVRFADAAGVPVTVFWPSGYVEPLRPTMSDEKEV